MRAFLFLGYMKYTIPLDLLDITADGYHLACNIERNGKPVRMILDTGASRTAFDIADITKAGEQLGEKEEKTTGLGTSGMESFFFEIGELNLGGLKIDGLEGIALDLSHVKKSYDEMGHSPIDGVIGGDVLVKWNAIIDYRKLELILEED